MLTRNWVEEENTGRKREGRKPNISKYQETSKGSPQGLLDNLDSSGKQFFPFPSLASIEQKRNEKGRLSA